MLNIDAYLERFGDRWRNRSGGRGAEHGIRIINCPLCGEIRGRGWLNVVILTAGCWNAGCDAAPRLSGGVIEWVRRAEKLHDRGEAWKFLAQFGKVSTVAAIARPPLPETPWVKFPDGTISAENMLDTKHRDVARVARFILGQWGVALENVAAAWKLAWVPLARGQWGGRVIVPFHLKSLPACYQGRASYQQALVRYRTSSEGTEASHPIGALLFNQDVLAWAGPGARVLLVEGVGDCLNWMERPESKEIVCVALGGTYLTPMRFATLAAAQPKEVIVALDPNAEMSAYTLAMDLGVWGIHARLGRWVGAKDAGKGAQLELQKDEPVLRDLIKQKLRFEEG